MTRSCLICVAVGTCLVLFGMSGCQHPGAQREMKYNQRSFNHMVAVLEDMESGRDQKVDRDLRFAEQNERLTAEKFQRDVTGLDRMVRDEFERWEQRQPAYRRSIHEQFKGDPANIDRTWPMVLY